MTETAEAVPQAGAGEDRLLFADEVAALVAELEPDLVRADCPVCGRDTNGDPVERRRPAKHMILRRHKRTDGRRHPGKDGGLCPGEGMEVLVQRRGIDDRSVIFYASQSRRRARQGKLTAYDLPVPRQENYALRRVPTKEAGVFRTVRAPRWPVSEIVAWREAMADRPAPSRDRDETGRYTPKG